MYVFYSWRHQDITDFIAVDLQLYKIFKITRVIILGHSVVHKNQNKLFLQYKPEFTVFVLVQ